MRYPKPLQRRDITLREPLTGNASLHSFLEMSIKLLVLHHINFARFVVVALALKIDSLDALKRYYILILLSIGYS
jgi:hypothetical protein